MVGLVGSSCRLGEIVIFVEVKFHSDVVVVDINLIALHHHIPDLVRVQIEFVVLKVTYSSLVVHHFHHEVIGLSIVDVAIQ